MKSKRERPHFVLTLTTTKTLAINQVKSFSQLHFGAKLRIALIIGLQFLFVLNNS